jgi:hypothetical protein
LPGRSLRRHLTWPISLDGVWLLAPLFALAAVALLSPIRPFDYFWALVQGRTTWVLGGVARENLFLYTVGETQPFFNQAWLAQLLLFIGYRSGGHTANLVVLALLLGAALACCMDGALRRGGRPVHVALAALVSLPLVGLGSGVRTQMFAYPCFALLLRFLLLEAPRLAPGPFVAILAASAFWANTHGSFVLAPLMFAARAAVGVWEQRHAGARLGVARDHTVELALVLGATCLNPRGPAVYAYAFGMPLDMGVGDATDVGEWQPISPLEPLGLTLVAVVVASVALATLRRGRVSPPALLVFLGCALLSFVSQRFLAWAALGLVLVLPVLTRPEAQARESDDRRGLAWVNAGLVATFALVTLGSVPGAPLFERVASDVHLPYAGARALGRETPLLLTERLAREGAAGRIFHDQALGGLLEWVLAADAPRPVAFVDQRFELIRPEIWTEYFSIASARPGWQALLGRYGVRTLLVDERRQRPLVDAIAHDGEWRLVAREFSYRLYVRSLKGKPGDG